MNNAINNANNANNVSASCYDNKMLRMITDTLHGDNADIQLPVKAARKLISAVGRIPVGGGIIEGSDLKPLMDEIEAGLRAERCGEILATMLPDGTRVCVFVY